MYQFGTDESYGIHVAKLAGVPKPVVTRAKKILKNLERKYVGTDLCVGPASKEEGHIGPSLQQQQGQLDMYNYKLAEIAHEIDKINLNELTPIDALNILQKIKEKMS